MSPQTAAASAPPQSPPPCTRQTVAPGCVCASTLLPRPRPRPHHRPLPPPSEPPSDWIAEELELEVEASPPRWFSCCSSSVARARVAPVTQHEERLHQFLPLGAGRAVWASTQCQSPTTRMFPAQTTSRLHPPSTGRGHRRGWSSCGCRSFSSPPAPACSSCLSSCREGGHGVWKGSLESRLLEDSLAHPPGISVPSSPRRRSHDCCGHSGGLWLEMKG